SGYLTSIEQRLRAAELERAAASARAVEERKRRKLTAALAVAALAVASIAGGSWGWIGRLGREQRQRMEGAMSEAALLHRQAQTAATDPAAWSEATRAARRMAELLGPRGDAELRRRIRRLASLIEEDSRKADHDIKFLRTLDEIRLGSVERLE